MVDAPSIIYRPRIYLVIFLVSAVATLSITASALWLRKVLACDATGYDGEHFLAYCPDEKFGDYEHGAFFYNLERSAVDNMRKAKVIMLGNSRTQFAFSTRAVSDFFARRSIDYFILGFGYSESDVFPLTLMRKYGVSPQVLIINADPFFTGRASSLADEVMAGGASAQARYMLKKAFERIHHRACAVVPSLCRPTEPSLYRSRVNGGWYWWNIYRPPETNNPIEAEDQRRTQIDYATAVGYVENARRFIANLGLSLDCVILTGIPNSFTNAEQIAGWLAEKLGSPVVIPRMEGLGTVDNSHLNAVSAERWSSKFLVSFDPVWNSCHTDLAPVRRLPKPDKIGNRRVDILN